MQQEDIEAAATLADLANLGSRPRTLDVAPAAATTTGADVKPSVPPLPKPRPLGKGFPAPGTPYWIIAPREAGDTPPPPPGFADQAHESDPLGASPGWRTLALGGPASPESPPAEEVPEEAKEESDAATAAASPRNGISVSTKSLPLLFFGYLRILLRLTLIRLCGSMKLEQGLKIWPDTKKESEVLASPRLGINVSAILRLTMIRLCGAMNPRVNTKILRETKKEDDLIDSPRKRVGVRHRQYPPPLFNAYYKIVLCLTLIHLCGSMKLETRNTILRENLEQHSNGNIIKFPWGVNFKFNAEVYTGLARTWVVTKIKVPNFNDLEFPSMYFRHDCPWVDTVKIGVHPKWESSIDDISPETTKRVRRRYYKEWCKTMARILANLNEKERQFKASIRSLMFEEMYTLFPDLDIDNEMVQEEKVEPYSFERPSRRKRSPSSGILSTVDSEWQDIGLQDIEKTLSEAVLKLKEGLSRAPSSWLMLGNTKSGNDSKSGDASGESKETKLGVQSIASSLRRSEREAWEMIEKKLSGLKMNTTMAGDDPVMDRDDLPQEMAMRKQTGKVEGKSRKKRWILPLVSAVGGLVTFAAERLTGHLKKKRERAVRQALDELSRRTEENSNKIELLEEYNLMFGRLAVNSIEEIRKDLAEWKERQTNLSIEIYNTLEQWRSEIEAFSIASTHISHMLLTFLLECSTVLGTYYVPLHAHLREFYNAINVLNSGRLPNNLFPPRLLQKLARHSQELIQKSHPQWELAIPNLVDYYKMQIVTFSVDRSDRSLVVAFPILHKRVNQKPYKLYEIETVHVPIQDQNPQANSYTRAIIQKPYIGTGPTSYIEMTIPEIRMCKQVLETFYCDEAFLVRDIFNAPSCASSLYYSDNWVDINKMCDFEYSFNKTVRPSILDGTDYILLANVVSDKRLVCENSVRPVQRLPDDNYLIINKTLLCHCTLDAENVEIPEMLTDCPDKAQKIEYFHTVNAAFLQAASPILNLTEMRNFIENTGPLLSRDQTLPIKLHRRFASLEVTNTSTTGREVETLKELVNSLERRTQERALGIPNISLRDVIGKTEPGFWEKSSKTINQVMMAALVVFGILGAVLLTVYCRNRAMIAGLLAKGMPIAMTAPVTETPQIYVCQFSWVPILAIVLTITGLCVFLYNNCRKRTFCLGFERDTYCELWLHICTTKRYVPIKLTNLKSSAVGVTLSSPLPKKKLTLNKNCLWDTLSMDWQDCLVQVNGTAAPVPFTAVVPLADKYRLRNMWRDVTGYQLMTKQRGYWFTVDSTEYEELTDTLLKRAKPPVPPARSTDGVIDAGTVIDIIYSWAKSSQATTAPVQE